MSCKMHVNCGFQKSTKRLKMYTAQALKISFFSEALQSNFQVFTMKYIFACVCSISGYSIYVDILTGENLALIQVADMNLIYWLVSSSSRRVKDGVQRVDGGIVILASCEYPFIRVHKNLVQYPSKNISIVPMFIISLCLKS